MRLRAMETMAARRTRIAIYLISFLGVVTALNVAQPILAPILSAVVIGVVLSPITDWLCRLGAKPAIAAFATLLLFLIVAIAILLGLEPSLSAAVAQAPVVWSEFRGLVQLARDAVSGLEDIQETVSDVLVPEANAAEGGTDPAEESETPLPVPSLFDALSYGPAVVGAILIFVGTLYFFLASRVDLYNQAETVVAGLERKKLHAAERRVSRYFLAITCINAGFGSLVTLAMMVLGMPYPAVWGVATFLLNFILYLGPATVAVALLVVGVVTFDGALSFLPVTIFVLLNMVEAQFATPMLVGQQMSLNPLLVFLSLIAWLWLWGPIGGVVAIPVLVWLLFMLSYDDKTQKAPG